MSHESPMAVALRQAGLQTLEERLVALLTEKMIEHAGSISAAAQAALIQITDREPALALPLHARPHHLRAVIARMETIRAEMAEAERQRRQAEAGGGGHRSSADQPSRAPTTTQAPPQGGVRRTGHTSDEDHGKIARPAPNAPQGAGGEGQNEVADQSASALPARSRPTAAIGPEARAAQASVAARGLLASVMVNGKPLADALPEEARAAGRAKLHGARAEAAEGRFLLAIAQNLPPDDPIGRWRTAEDAEAVMAAATGWARGRLTDAEQ